MPRPKKNISFSNTLTKASSNRHEGRELPELHLAAEKGNLDHVKGLAKKKKRLHERNYFGGTALTVATLHGHAKIVEYLLLRGSDVNTQTSKGYAPLHVAAKIGDKNIAEILLRRGGNVNLQTSEGYTPLFIACFCGKRELVRCFIGAKVNVNLAAVDGTTCLHSATEMGYDDLVSMLIKGNANVNEVMCDGETPLHIACRRGHARIVTLFLDSGAETDLSTIQGVTPLHLACRYGHKDIVKQLLQAGSNVQSKMTLTTDGAQEETCDAADTTSISGHSVMNGPHSTPSSRAGSVRSVSMRTIVNRDPGWTGLHFAAYGGYTDISKMLLVSGANVNFTTARGKFFS